MSEPQAGCDLLRSYLKFASKLARVNYAGAERDGFGHLAGDSKLPLWSRAVEIFIYCATSIMVADCLLQNNYNRAREEFVALNATTHESNKDSPLLRQKEAQLARAIELVEMIENPLYEVGRPLEVVAIFIGITLFQCYMEPRIFNHLCGPFEVRVVRLFLDPKLERELMLKNELMPLINSYIRSAVNYLAVSKHKLVCSHEKHKLARPSSESIATSLSSRRRLRKLKMCQVQNVELLRNMVASGELEPLNRRSEWARTLALIYGRLIVWFLALGLFQSVLFLIVAPCSGWLGVKVHYGWRGILFTLVGLAYCALFVQIGSFVFISIFTRALDLIEFATALTRVVSKLSRDIAADRADLTSGLVTRRLMRVLIQYKLFKQQLCGSHAVVGLISANLISAMLLVSALARVYVAKSSADLKYPYLIFCLLMIEEIDMVLLPGCHLHARCLELYRAMSHLLAHLDAAASHYNQANCASKIYIDEHTLWLLRRELHQPDFTTQQFATDAHFTRLTYANLMGVHFYCGLWLAPMFMRDTAGLASGTSDLLNLI